MTAIPLEGLLLDVLDPKHEGVDPEEAAHGAIALQEMPEARVTIIGPGDVRVTLPHAVAHVLAAVLNEAAQGNAVAVVATQSDEVTTTAAARLLGVSRPHVAKLIDTGILRGRRAGTHRRVRLADLMAYKRETERGNAVLDQLAEETAALGLYNAPRYTRSRREA
jgi:excisionase family DNA binding protein